MTETGIRIVKALRDGLPLCEEPYVEIARRAGVSQDDLLAQLQAWKDDGTIRRLGAILHHQQAGFTVNAMGVWNVPDDRIEDFGRSASNPGAVSHCYQRPRFAGFEFNVYTMIHGKSKEECEVVALGISQQTGVTDYRLLYTTAEFKKSSPEYFADVD